MLTKQTKKFDCEIYNKENSYANAISLFLIVVCCFFILYFLMFNIKYTIKEVSGPSMQPTLNNNSDPKQKNDIVLVSKLDAPTAFDIVIMDDKNLGLIIKRVIGLAGDRISIKADNTSETYVLYKNGVKISEPYLLATETMEQTYSNFQELKLKEPNNFNENGEYIVPKNHIFLLGDNRSNSTDSSVVGAFPMSEYVGVVTDVVYYGESLIMYLVHYFLGFHIKL